MGKCQCSQQQLLLAAQTSKKPRIYCDKHYNPAKHKNSEIRIGHSCGACVCGWALTRRAVRTASHNFCNTSLSCLTTSSIFSFIFELVWWREAMLCEYRACCAQGAKVCRVGLRVKKQKPRSFVVHCTVENSDTHLHPRRCTRTHAARTVPAGAATATERGEPAVRSTLP